MGARASASDGGRPSRPRSISASWSRIATAFVRKLRQRGIRVVTHGPTPGYPTDVDTIVSDAGYAAFKTANAKRQAVVFQGANDGGSSTGVLLALAEHLAERKPRLRHTVRFAFFDGEECFGDTYRDNDGLHGSRRMAAQFVRDRVEMPLVAAIVLWLALFARESYGAAALPGME